MNDQKKEVQSQQAFKNAYKTRCNGCASMLMLALPNVHCPSCHHIWRSRKLASPTRCPRCDFSIWRWRAQNGIEDNSNAGALIA